MRTFEHPPMILTIQTPEDIIGPHNMDALEQHIRQYAANCNRPGRKVDKGMAEMITRLQAHGYYVDGFKADGSICFRTVLQSQVQARFEGPELEEIKLMSMDEMRAKARGGYVGMRTDDEFGKLRN
jgi:hypothetical protein